MRCLALSLLLVSFGGAVSAQQQQPAPNAGAPDLVVLKFNWSKERVGWEGDPFAGPIENMDQMRVRVRNEKRLDDLKRSGNQSEYNRAQADARTDAAIFDKMRGEARPARYAFLYKASFRNSGAKAVKSIDWDYVFLDAASGEEIGRHQFTADQKIAPGKQGGATVYIATPPTRTISVHALNSKERKGLSERVEVVRVVYDDDTVWERR